MRIFLILLYKELRLELRSKFFTATILSLALLLSVLMASSLQTLVVERRILERLFPAVLWVIVVFSATLALARGADHDLENRTHDSLLLAGATSGKMFAARVLAVSAVIAANALVCAGMLAVLLNLKIGWMTGNLVVIAVLMAFGFASLAVQLLVISNNSPIRGVLLSLMLFPLSLPIILSTVELTASTLSLGALDLGSPHLSLIVAADLVYFIAGINLYEHLLRE